MSTRKDLENKETTGFVAGGMRPDIDGENKGTPSDEGLRSRIGPGAQDQYGNEPSLNVDRIRVIPGQKIVSRSDFRADSPEVEAEDVVSRRGKTPFERTFFAYLLGALLFVTGAFISVAFGIYTGIGLVFGLGFIIAGIFLPYTIVRGSYKPVDVAGNCPFCDYALSVKSYITQTTCPNCHNIVIIENGRLLRGTMAPHGHESGHRA